MERVYRSPILILFTVYLFMLMINHNTDALPHHADGTIKNPEVQWSNNGGEWTRDRRNIVNTTTESSPKGFIDFSDMQWDAFVFPDDIEHMAVSMQQVPVTPVCKGPSTSTYCDTVTSYPEQTVNEALKRNESLKYLAVVDEVSESESDTSIVQRFDADDDVPLCVSTEQVIYVQAAMNKNNEWRYIANQENFKQGIRIEKCSNENAACSTVNAPGVGYKTSCKQKYAYRQLVAVQPDNTLVLDSFQFPSSCCCHLTFSGRFTPRTGFMGFGAKKHGSNIT